MSFRCYPLNCGGVCSWTREVWQRDGNKMKTIFNKNVNTGNPYSYICANDEFECEKYQHKVHQAILNHSFSHSFACLRASDPLNRTIPNPRHWHPSHQWVYISGGRETIYIDCNSSLNSISFSPAHIFVCTRKGGPFVKRNGCVFFLLSCHFMRSFSTCCMYGRDFHRGGMDRALLPAN